MEHNTSFPLSQNGRMVVLADALVALFHSGTQLKTIHKKTIPALNESWPDSISESLMPACLLWQNPDQHREAQ